MPAKVNTRIVRGPSAAEVYISAAPADCARTQEEFLEVFSAVRDVLETENSHIFQERVFVADGAADIISPTRRQAYGELDDGVSPSWLAGKQGRAGELAGVQVYAVACANKPGIVEVDGRACGRVLKMPGRAYLALSGVSGADTADTQQQAKEVFEKADSTLKQFGKDFACVARTWMWLGDILSWYGRFNQVRNQFFIQKGLIGADTRHSMPASTGIGLGMGRASRFGMDLLAVLESATPVEFLGALGHQQCALEYGSAFSRASRVDSPAGRTTFISGTASIDAKGATTHLGDAKGQIETTIENVRAVLRDVNCRDSDVVQIVAYCKTAEVESVFEQMREKLDWPWITVICDICREDLLFEIEAVAAQGYND